MSSNFDKNRLALFTKSYAGYFLGNYIRQSKKPEILLERLAKVLLFKEKSLYCFIFHKTCQRKFDRIIKNVTEDKEKIAIYLKIEKELMIITQEREDKNSLISEDYEYALLSPAIERVAGNTLANVNDDGIFDTKLIELKNQCTRWYYEIAYRYRLPTLRIIPFILRLIA